jgi:hypothetical protein
VIAAASTRASDAFFSYGIIIAQSALAHPKLNHAHQNPGINI